MKTWRRFQLDLLTPENFYKKNLLEVVSDLGRLFLSSFKCFPAQHSLIFSTSPVCHEKAESGFLNI